MAVIVDSYTHRTGEHCASTALRNILSHRGTELSEGMIFGLASGLGFYYVHTDAMSPTRMFHGRTLTLESDFGLNTGIPFTDRPEPDDERAWRALRDRIDRGEPVMISTDTFYLGYHKTTSHFPGHRCVVVGYDDASQTVSIADRKFEALQQCSYEELRRARNAPDHPMSCENQYGDFGGAAELGRPLAEAIRVAIRRNAQQMLEPESDLPAGIPALNALAADFADWAKAEDWSWAARFGYQVVVKRGAGGSFFRSLYADFLRESGPLVPGIARVLPPERMEAIASRWRDLAALLKDQSEREECEPALFTEAGRVSAELAAAEQEFFTDALRATA